MRAFAWAAALLLVAVSPLSAQTVPQFQVDPSWLKPLPNNWLPGQVANIAVDSNDHVWVLQRPRTLTDDEKGASLKPPRNTCCVPAPSVMEFDAEGNFVQGLGVPRHQAVGDQRARSVHRSRRRGLDHRQCQGRQRDLQVQPTTASSCC